MPLFHLAYCGIASVTRFAALTPNPHTCAYAHIYTHVHTATSLTIGGLVVNAPANVASMRYKIVTFRMTAAGVGLWGQVGSLPS